MTAILKVDTIQDTSGNNIINESSDTITIGASGDTVNVPGTEVKTNKISPTSGTGLQLGDSGDTITIPSGATITNSGTASGFGGGKINQVLQTDASYDTTSSSAVELFSLAITPSASNSKISIIYSASAQLQNNEYCSFDLYRGSLSSGTKIQDGEGSFFVAGSSANIRMYYSSSDLDSPNTTNATTYTVVGVPTNSSTIQFGPGGRGSITLMEVLA